MKYFGHIPKIICVPVTQQRFTTLGDWWQNDDGSFTISISEMDDWCYETLVLIHELTEWAICQATGVSTKDCDAFDAMWEEDIDAGLVSIEVEAGFDKKCPYRKGHVWGYRMERLFCWLLGASWKEYGWACDELIEEYDMNRKLVHA